MLWFYWRRVRLGVLVAGVALGSVAVLAIVAGAVSQGTGPAPSHKTLASRISGQQPRRVGQVPVDAASIHRGVSLMSAAVTACNSVSYAGVQMVAWWGAGDSTAYLIGVWHRSGEPEVADGVRGAGGDPSPGSVAQHGTAAADHATAGVLSVSPWMLSLLRTNYVIEYSGAGTAVGRQATIVAVRRHDGTLAARYWLDSITGLPLRREMFDEGGHLVNEGAFINLSLGPSAPEPAPSQAAQAWSADPDVGRTSELPRLRKEGWPVPSRLDGDMSLVGVSRDQVKSGAVVDASYSDGLSVVSVFMQRGQLADALPGWRSADVRGLPVYSSEPDQRSLAWSADGVVYTVISDAPPTAVDLIVAQLPHDHNMGLWQRVSRGLERIGSWFDPFG
jgi:sigma-E factor negative regulatory protein RseB